MARKPLARRIARLTPLLAAAACAAVPSAASAQATYPTGDGLVVASFADGVFSSWPDGTDPADWLVHGTVGTFDGNGYQLSVRTANHIVGMFSIETRQSVANMSYSGAIGATALNPAGTNWEAVTGANLSSFSGVANGEAVWTAHEPAVGRFGWATKPGKQRKVFLAGPGAVNGGGQDVAGSVMVLEADGSKWPIPSHPGAQNPTVSPDGRWVAYELASDDQRDVYLFDLEADGSPFLAAEQTSADEYLPTFSPDSQRLVFARADGNSTQIREIPVAASGISRHVYTYPMSDATGLAWQPSVKPTAGAVPIDTQTVPETGKAVTFTSGPNSGYKPQVETFTWQRCDGDECSDLTAGTSYTPVAGDIGFTLRVKRVVRGPAGESTKYSSETPKVIAAVVPPAKPTFTRTPAKVTNEYYPQFEFTGAQPGGTFECRVIYYLVRSWEPDTGWIPCQSPAGTPALNENGDYIYKVRQVDGTVKGEEASYEFTVDHEPPAKPELLFTKVKDLSASVSFLAGSNEPGVTFECRLDAPMEIRAVDHGPKWEPCAGAWSREGLTEGKHELQIRAKDKAGNYSDTVFAHWINKAPVVETPAPVVEAPKPAPVPAPVVEEPKPAAPRAVAKPEVKAPALVATIGGTKSGAQVGANGSTSAAATIEVAKESVGVGCSITGTVLKSCKVDLYAPKASGATARAAASNLVLVGTGTYVSKGGSEEMDVKIELNSVGKKMLRENPAGLRVQVKILGKPVSGKPLQATGVAKLVTDRASLTVGGFDVRSSVLTSTAKKQLRTLAKFGKAGRVTCVGHTDGSSQDDDYLKSLGARRAKAVCAYLAKHGLKASSKRLASKADTKPAATNATKAGRAKNRRVQVTIVR